MEREKSQLYSWLEIRSIEEEGVIEGIATTPKQARDGDILETEGIQFKLPIPFLYRHNEPFGNVVAASVTSDGIRVRIEVKPEITTKIQEQWNLVKSGTVRGLSIGWRTIQEAFDKSINGFRIQKSEWLELSAVPVGSDPNALITSIRSADEAILAELAPPAATVPARSNPPGDSGKPKKAKRKTAMKAYTEQIDNFVARQAEIKAKMSEIMSRSVDGALEGEDGPAYDLLREENKTLITNIDRLHALEEATAEAVPANARSEQRQQTRKPIVQEVKDRPTLPPGFGMARMVIALCEARGNRHLAAQLAREHYHSTSPQVEMALRAAVSAGDTFTPGWAAELVPAARQLQGEFLGLLYPAALIGKITGLMRVPFNVAVPLATDGGTYNWVGEGKPKPVTSAQFDSATLRWAKAAGIMTITRELARFSTPSAEMIIRNLMIKGCAKFLDEQFINESVIEVANVHPAGILNGISPETPTGTTAEAFRYDLNVLLTNFTANNQDPTTAVILMSATTALSLGAMVNALGNQEFPNMTMTGGTINGIPVVVSQSVGARIVLINASDILFADDGQISVDVSEQASVEMSTTPIAGDESPTEGAVLKSLWQNNLVGLRVETFMTWKVARTSAVEWLNNVAYAPTQPGSPA